MLSLEKIEQDYRTALEQADRLESLANSVRSMGQSKLPGIMGSISSTWAGENAEAFTMKGNLLGENIVSLSGNLESAAAEVRSIAARTYQEELEQYRREQEALHSSSGDGESGSGDSGGGE